MLPRPPVIEHEQDAPGAPPRVRLPLHLVTGFLGSGKTTLVNALLRDPAFAGAMVVVNEFGEVGLDHLLISEGQDQVLLLESGCLCCAASGTLRDTLIDLFARRGSGTLPAFDRIVVETSGLVNPVPVVAGLLGDSALVARCRLAGVLTLVDATAGASTLARHAEARQQVALADRLLVTKAEQVADPARLDALRLQLRDLNPHAPIGTRQPGDAPATYFADTAPLPAPAAAGVPGTAAAAWMRGPLRPQYGAEPAPAHDASYRAIRTHSWHLPALPGWAEYALWSGTMTRRFGAALLRCKGVLQIDGAPWVVQGVQGYFAAPERLVSAAYQPGQAFIVCIVDGLDRAALEPVMALLLDAPAAAAVPI